LALFSNTTDTHFVLNKYTINLTAARLPDGQVRQVVLPLWGNASQAGIPFS
jgi:hypothetical protein